MDHRAERVLHERAARGLACSDPVREHDRRHRPGPEGVSAAEAIAWGREHADRVLIRLVDSEYYSAGSKPAADLEPWPEHRVVEPRRQPGMEHLDVVSDDPIAWQVRLPRRISRRRTDVDLAALRAALEADPAVTGVLIDVERAERRRVNAILRFRVEARSHAEAVEAVLEVERRLEERAPFPVDEMPRGVFIVFDGLDPMRDVRLA